MKKRWLILVLVFTVLALVFGACTNPAVEDNNIEDSDSVYTGTRSYETYTFTVQLAKGRAMPEANNNYVLTVTSVLGSNESTGKIKTVYSDTTSTFVLQPGIAGATEFTVFTKDTTITYIRGAITWDNGTKVQEPGSFTYVPSYYPGGYNPVGNNPSSTNPSEDNSRITVPATP